MSCVQIWLNKIPKGSIPNCWSNGYKTTLRSSIGVFPQYICMFSLNSANSVTKIVLLSKEDCCAWTCHLLCKKPARYLSTTRTLVTEKIFNWHLFMLQWSLLWMEQNFHWIQRIWEITEAWIGFSRRICFVACGSVAVVESLSLTQEILGSNLAIFLFDF